ncbi:hypothetical protein BN13_610014 [Nostocoides jenkinsii Ben 74]|uniref:Uncharacterized protein n=1 Tax=Nostocoides jenkinsii Ben 74 TaxID=1193518 RepID=A0A077MFW4_9MICO|nr:hypothetical protein BN13_610014 [Tetrasphaera jenkinsii Ben 74]
MAPSTSPVTQAHGHHEREPWCRDGTIRHTARATAHTAIPASTIRGTLTANGSGAVGGMPLSRRKVLTRDILPLRNSATRRVETRVSRAARIVLRHGAAHHVPP